MSEKNGSRKIITDFLKLQIINFIIDLSVLFVVCAVCVGADLKQEYVFFAALLLIGICSFLSGFTAGIKERRNGMIKGVISGLPFNLIIMLVSLIMNGFSADLNALFTFLGGLLFSAIGGIVSVNIRIKH